MQQHFEIAGTGSYLPATLISAAAADTIGGLEPGWTAAHTGVLTRYFCREPESLQSMAVAAIGPAMEFAGVDWRDIDLIIDASASQYRPLPGNAIHVQAACGNSAAGIPCMDVHSTCLGFILAMNTANALFAVHDYRHILIVCSERSSLSANWNEPESAALIGDGAAAVVLRKSKAKNTVAFAHETFAEHIDSCLIHGGGHMLLADEYRPEVDEQFRFHMDGPAMMRVAARHLPPMFQSLLNAADSLLNPTDQMNDQRPVIVPHQASPRASKIMRRLLGVEKERFLGGVESFGNIASAGIPMVLDRAVRNKAIDRHDRVMLLGTSAGYSQAGLVFEF